MISDRQTPKELTAVILAAGRGRRLKPFTDHLPKCLLPIKGRPLMEGTLRTLIEAQIRETVIVTGYRDDLIREYIGKNFPARDIAFIHNPHFDSTNTAYSLWLGLKKTPGAFILIDGDLVFDPLILRMMMQASAENLMAVDFDSPLDDEAMKVAIRQPGHQIENLGKNLFSGGTRGEFIGLGRFSGEWARLLKKKMDSLFEESSASTLYYEDVMASLVKEAPPLFALNTENRLWGEIDTAEDYRRINGQIREPLS